MATKQKIIFSILLIGIVTLVLFGAYTKTPPQIEITSEKPSEIQLIKTNEFRKFLDLTVNPQMIDDNGAGGRNLNGFLEVSAQRIAAKMIMRSIADNNEELIEKGIKAIEYGFGYQNIVRNSLCPAYLKILENLYV